MREKWLTLKQRVVLEREFIDYYLVIIGLYIVLPITNNVEA